MEKQISVGEIQVGDKIRVVKELTVSEYYPVSKNIQYVDSHGHNQIIYSNISDDKCNTDIYLLDRKRTPAHWPPQLGDVWRCSGHGMSSEWFITQSTDNLADIVARTAEGRTVSIERLKNSEQTELVHRKGNNLGG